MIKRLFAFILVFVALSGLAFGQQPMMKTLSVVAQLRNLNPADFNRVVTVLGGLSENDGNGGIYFWNSLSVLADDGDSVISTPRASTGRWIKLTSLSWGNQAYYTSIDDMLDNANPVSAKIVGVIGYYAPDGIGSGSFVAVTPVSSTNRGTVFRSRKNSNYVFKRMSNRKLNAFDFGAKGDDSHDDSDNLQDMINVAASGQYSIQEYSPGVYKTTKTLYVLNNRSACIMNGSGMVGPTAFSPLAYSGTMIRYYGTTNYAMVFGDGVNPIFHTQIEDFRFGTAGQTPKPGGVFFNNISECAFRNLQFTGGFDSAIRGDGVTLCQFYGLTVEANQYAISTGNNSVGTGWQDNLFYGANFYLNDTNLVINGNFMYNTMKDSWMEDGQVMIYNAPPTNNIKNFLNNDFDNVAFHTAARVNGLALMVDAGSSSVNSLHIENLTFRNCFVYGGGTNAFVFFTVTNTGPNSLSRNIVFDNIQGYVLSAALVYGDNQNTQVEFKGLSHVYDGYGSGTEKPWANGPLKRGYDLRNNLGYRDFGPIPGEGMLFHLPSANPDSFAEGQFGFSYALHKIIWTDGSSAIFPATADNQNILTSYVEFSPAPQNAPTIASASTIAPLKRRVFVSGSAAIDTITPPSKIALTGGEITLIATGAWTCTTSGNIASTFSATANKSYVFTYDFVSNKWYPPN